MWLPFFAGVMVGCLIGFCLLAALVVSSDVDDMEGPDA